MSEQEIRREIKRLQDLLPKKGKSPSAVRITADGVEQLSPRKAALLAAKAEAQRTGRVVTVIVSSRQQ